MNEMSPLTQNTIDDISQLQIQAVGEEINPTTIPPIGTVDSNLEILDAGEEIDPTTIPPIGTVDV